MSDVIDGEFEEVDEAQLVVVVPPVPFVPGTYDDMPAELYHAIEALSSSGVSKLLQSPAHYRLTRDQPSAPTPAMRFGSAVHCGVLEPSRFAQAVARAPAVNKRTKDGKAAWSLFVKENAGRIILSPKDMDRAQRCIDAVLANPSARQLLAGAQVERSLLWVDGQYNVPCKARLDAWNAGLLVDLKTTGDASPEEFGNSIANFRYHVQAAMYCSAAEHVLNESPEAYVFIAVESEPPHGCRCYRLPPAAILVGQRYIARALERYAEVLRDGVWRGYPETIDTIQLPRRAMRFDN